MPQDTLEQQEAVVVTAAQASQEKFAVLRLELTAAAPLGYSLGSVHDLPLGGRETAPAFKFSEVLKAREQATTAGVARRSLQRADGEPVLSEFFESVKGAVGASIDDSFQGFRLIRYSDDYGTGYEGTQYGDEEGDNDGEGEEENSSEEKGDDEGDQEGDNDGDNDGEEEEEGSSEEEADDEGDEEGSYDDSAAVGKKRKMGSSSSGDREAKRARMLRPSSTLSTQDWLTGKAAKPGSQLIALEGVSITGDKELAAWASATRDPGSGPSARRYAIAAHFSRVLRNAQQLPALDGLFDGGVITLQQSRELVAAAFAASGGSMTRYHVAAMLGATVKTADSAAKHFDALAVWMEALILADLSNESTSALPFLFPVDILAVTRTARKSNEGGTQAVPTDRERSMTAVACAVAAEVLRDLETSAAFIDSTSPKAESVAMSVAIRFPPAAVKEDRRSRSLKVMPAEQSSQELAVVAAMEASEGARHALECLIVGKALNSSIDGGNSTGFPDSYLIPEASDEDYDAAKIGLPASVAKVLSTDTAVRVASLKQRFEERKTATGTLSFQPKPIASGSTRLCLNSVACPCGLSATAHRVGADAGLIRARKLTEEAKAMLAAACLTKLDRSDLAAKLSGKAPSQEDKKTAAQVFRKTFDVPRNRGEKPSDHCPKQELEMKNSRLTIKDDGCLDASCVHSHYCGKCCAFHSIAAFVHFADRTRSKKCLAQLLTETKTVAQQQRAGVNRRVVRSTQPGKAAAAGSTARSKARAERSRAGGAGAGGAGAGGAVAGSTAAGSAAAGSAAAGSWY